MQRVVPADARIVHGAGMNNRALTLAAVAVGLSGCMLGTQYFNSHAVTKRSDGDYNDMNPLGISGCKAKRKAPGTYEVFCRCGGGGSTEGCLDSEHDTVDKGFDDYAHRVCTADGFRDHDVESKENPPVPAGEDEESKAVITRGVVRCR
jgi:hypothetical protein